MMRGAINSPRRHSASSSSPRQAWLPTRFIPAILTVIVCYTPLVVIKFSERLEDGPSLRRSCVAGCRCLPDVPPAPGGISLPLRLQEAGPSSAAEAADGYLASGKGGETEDSDEDGEDLPDKQAQAAEAWEEYVQASLQASISPSCKFALPERLVAKAKAQVTGAADAAVLLQPSPAAAPDEPKSCRAMESDCRLDASCREGDEFAALLASTKCQGKSNKENKKTLFQGCKQYYSTDMRDRTSVAKVPEHCFACVRAFKTQEAACRRKGRKCEEALARCYQAKHLSKGSSGTLQWLSFWDEGNYNPEDFTGWANFGFSKDVTQICRGAAMGQRHMLKVGSCFLGRSPTFNSKHKKRLVLVKDWEQRWERFREVAANLMASGAIFGVFLGDELLWSGLSLASIEDVASRIRADLPGVVIWINEARAPVVDGHTQFQGARFRMPPSVDWISVDVYHYTPDPDYLADLRRLYVKHIYPQLRPNQSVVLVPGAFSSTKNSGCDAECYDEFMTADADAITRWAWEDDKVVGVVPYHWNHCPHCHGTRNEIGLRDMQKAKERWRSIGPAIAQNQESVLIGQCSSQALRAVKGGGNLRHADDEAALAAAAVLHPDDELRRCLVSPPMGRHR